MTDKEKLVALRSYVYGLWKSVDEMRDWKELDDFEAAQYNAYSNVLQYAKELMDDEYVED